jgi:hypothetical protein
MGAVCAVIETAQKNDVLSLPQVLAQVFQQFILRLALQVFRQALQSQPYTAIYLPHSATERFGPFHERSTAWRQKTPEGRLEIATW